MTLADNASAARATGTLVRVVKVGGSLLSRSDLSEKLRDWLAARPEGHSVLVAGGGEIVEAIRAADRAHRLGEVTAHWLSIRAMSVTAELLAALSPNSVLLTDWDDLQRRKTAVGATVFDVHDFLRCVEPDLPGRKLPASWHVTSDSIAARLAIGLGADELALLKSSWPPRAEATIAELSSVGYVDRFLPKMAAEAPPIRCVCL